MGGSWDAYLEGRLNQQLHLSKASLPVLLSQLALFSSIVAMRSRTAIMPEILRHGSTVAAFRPCKLPDQHARHLVDVYKFPNHCWPITTTACTASMEQTSL